MHSVCLLMLIVGAAVTLMYHDVTTSFFLRSCCYNYNCSTLAMLADVKVKSFLLFCLLQFYL